MDRVYKKSETPDAETKIYRITNTHDNSMTYFTQWDKLTIHKYTFRVNIQLYTVDKRWQAPELG